MSYLENQSLHYNSKNQIKVICDHCGTIYECLYKSAEKNRKKNGKHKCHVCSGVKQLSPQNSSEFWTKERRENLGKKLTSSQKYKNAIKQRPSVAGKNNPMYGTNASIETRQKMSRSRTGKIGENATAWKGGKCTVNKRVKRIIYCRYNWSGRVMERDEYKCTKCNCEKRLDAHHIEPMNKIIKRLCANKTFNNDNEKVIWLIEQPDVVDYNLTNGVTLCRICHRQAHENWGSHNCE